MFTHHNHSGKCEWLGGALDMFVKHYNESAGTEYVLPKCLDLVRNSGKTPKEAEVLLTDKSDGKQMVIERKSVVWPESHIAQHKLEHEFADQIRETTKDIFHDARYMLSVRTSDLRNLAGKRVRDAGKEIGSEILSLTRADLPFTSAQPINWSFGETEWGDEEDNSKGIFVFLEGNVLSDSSSLALAYSECEDAIAAMTKQVRRQLESAAAKFKGYEKQLRLVLLDFYCEKLSEDDVPPMMENILVPETVDEIWRTVRDWVSSDDYEVGYDRLFKRAS